MPHHFRSYFASVIALCAIAFITLASIQAQAQTAPKSPMSPEQRQEIESLVQDYILQNPEILLQSLQQFQAKQEAEEQARAQASLAQQREAILNNPADPSFGPADAPITVVEFFDYQCGYCKRVLPAMMRLIDEQKDIRIILKEFPFLGPESLLAANAALAAKRQDLYLPFHEALMQNRGKLTQSRILEIATAVGLDIQELTTDMQDPEITQHLTENRKIGRQIGVTGTPAMIIGNQLIPGAQSYDQMVALIEAERTRLAQAQSEKE